MRKSPECTTVPASPRKASEHASGREWVTRTQVSSVSPTVIGCPGVTTSACSGALSRGPSRAMRRRSSVIAQGVPYTGSPGSAASRSGTAPR
jgi:hypothetical protein